MNNQKQQTDTPTPRDAWSLALASAEEISSPPELQGSQQKEQKATDEEEVASSDEKIMPGAVAEAGAFTGPRNRTPKPGNAPSSALGRGKKDPPSLALASAEERSNPPELEGSQRQGRKERKGRGKRAPRDAVAVAGVFTGPTGPPVLSEPRGPSATDEPSLIIAELAEPYQEDEELLRRNKELEEEDEELRRRYQELQQIVSEAVTGTVVVDDGGGGDHDQNAASSPFGRKGMRFFMGAGLALLLVIGIILGVAIPLATKNDKDTPSIDSVVTPTQSQSPTQSPTDSPTESPTAAPTKAPTAAPTACTSLDCLAKILLQNEAADAEALQDESSPQFLALHWLANEDTGALDLDSTPTVILVERYVLAVLYFATIAESGLNVLHFLSASSVCEWNNGEIGVLCDRDDLVVALLLGKSKHHKEVIVLTSLTKLSLHTWIGLSCSYMSRFLTFPCHSV
jgi:hypothetical protein